MNTLQKSLITLAAGSLLTVGAQAAVNYGGGYVGQPYVGVKAGQMKTDIDNFDTDKPTAYGVYAGYNFDPNFGMEVEYMGTDKADLTRGAFKGEYDAKTYGAYGTYRYYFPNTGLYGKGKLGIARTEAEGTAGIWDVSQKETSLAGGVGLGFQPSPNLGIEAEYAKAGSDSDLITLGAHIKF